MRVHVLKQDGKDTPVLLVGVHGYGQPVLFKNCTDSGTNMHIIILFLLNQMICYIGKKWLCGCKYHSISPLPLIGLVIIRSIGCRKHTYPHSAFVWCVKAVNLKRIHKCDITF